MRPYRNHAPRRSISPSFRSYVASQAILSAEANIARRSARVAHITRETSHAPFDPAPSERAGPLKNNGRMGRPHRSGAGARRQSEIRPALGERERRVHRHAPSSPRTRRIVHPHAHGGTITVAGSTRRHAAAARAPGPSRLARLLHDSTRKNWAPIYARSTLAPPSAGGVTTTVRGYGAQRRRRLFPSALGQWPKPIAWSPSRHDETGAGQQCRHSAAPSAHGASFTVLTHAAQTPPRRAHDT